MHLMALKNSCFSVIGRSFTHTEQVGTHEYLNFTFTFSRVSRETQ